MDWKSQALDVGHQTMSKALTKQEGIISLVTLVETKWLCDTDVML